MKNLKENKGITLVALIITIIVLLILAVVAISAVTGDGIISKAKTARENYQTAQENENLVLENYMKKLNNLDNSEIDEEENEECIIVISDEDNDEKYFCLYYAKSEMNKSDLESILNEEFDYCTYGGQLSDGVKQEYYNVLFLNSDYIYTYENGEMSPCLKNSGSNNFGEIKSSILGTPVTKMGGCFEDCELNNVPTIPNTIIELDDCFHRTKFNLSSITTITIPKSVESIGNLFNGAKNMDKIRIEYEGAINEYKQITNYNKLGSIGLVIHCTDGDYTTTES